MKDFENLLKNFQNREQIKYTVQKLVNNGTLDKIGLGKSTEYKAGKQMEDSLKIFNRAIQLGFEEMQKRGELPNS